MCIEESAHIQFVTILINFLKTQKWGILNVQINPRKLSVLLCLCHYLGFHLNGKKPEINP